MWRISLHVSTSDVRLDRHHRAVLLVFGARHSPFDSASVLQVVEFEPDSAGLTLSDSLKLSCGANVGRLLETGIEARQDPNVTPLALPTALKSSKVYTQRRQWAFTPPSFELPDAVALHHFFGINALFPVPKGFPRCCEAFLCPLCAQASLILTGSKSFSLLASVMFVYPAQCKRHLWLSP